MEAGGKDCEEETLQTAFKKLRVDAESVPAAVSVSEGMAPRAAPRPVNDSSGARPKLSCSKDNWHGCMRKTSRSAARTQRRRRSKSPILHPPKFTYCSRAAASTMSTPGGCTKHQGSPVAKLEEPCPALDGRSQKDLSSGTDSLVPLLVFGSGNICEKSSLQEISNVDAPVIGQGVESPGGVQPNEGSGLEKSVYNAPLDSEFSGLPQRCGSAEATDFRALSKLHCHADAAHASSCCPSQNNASDSQETNGQTAESQCLCQSHDPSWHGVEVYSFTGLREVISKCEQSLPSHENSPRTNKANAASSSSSSSSPLASGSPRSCSEQARSCVDDITIEDLSGYMEYYLYIPKKMSHMAEMMYT